MDPAPPAVQRGVPELRSTLLDEALPLFDRYRAMFALRNIGTEEAVLALGDGEITIVCLDFFIQYSHYSTARGEAQGEDGLE